MKIALKSLLLTTAVFVVTAVPTQAEPGPMVRAKQLADQAHDILKNDATTDKGGHRVAAMKLLKQAIAEIEAGIAFDKANVTRGENKRKR